MTKIRKATLVVIAAISGACCLGLAIVSVSFVHYQPAVVAAPGYDLLWPTRPGGLWAGAVKSYQRFFEMRPCEYTILGWDANDTLFYQASCQGATSQVWAYDVDQGGRLDPANTVPEDLLQETVPRKSILEQVRAPQVPPASAEPNVRILKVRVDGLASPDGRWVAVVVRHVYGPEDVIVVSN